MKPGKEPRFRQPYRLSRYDETRLKFLFEEAEHEGKQVRYELGEQPPRMCTPCFIVEKKGSLIGRKVGDFQMFNQLTEDYYYPAPDAEATLLEACGHKFHSLFDCVWGFEQIDLDEESSVLCSTITPFGVYRPKKLPMGIKQGPAIYQHMQNTAFECEYKPTGVRLCEIFFDDTYMGDATLEDHLMTLEHVLKVARKYNIQYRLAKCVFCMPEVLLLGLCVPLPVAAPTPRSWNN